MGTVIKELVTQGYDLVALLGNQHGMHDAASLVQRLTAQLDITAVALREMTRKRDAEHDDVLTWEKTMFKACGEDGHKSVAAKFAAMEAKCTALAAELKQSQIDAGCYKKGMEASNERLVQVAAENAGLKKYICDECYVENVRTGHYACAGHGMPSTPATDAFLAEVRAQGVEIAVAMFVEESQHLPNETRSVLRDVEGMADLIRKGGTH